MEAGWEAWVTVGVILLMLVALIRDIARTDLVILGALAILLVFGILTPEQAFGGFSNKAVLAVGALFVVAAGVQKTGALQFAERLLFSPSGNLQITT
ncbi:MAG: anion permease, partial [Calditrichaeota bacterium]|nr:anion permease [Calditrichota bacterium]